MLPLSAAGLRLVQYGEGWFETAQVQEQPVLVYSQAVTTPTGQHQIVQLAFPIGQQEASLSTLRLILLAGSLIATLIAVAVGWILPGAGLSPIQRITQTTETIGAEHNFSHRVAIAARPTRWGSWLRPLTACWPNLKKPTASFRTRWIPSAPLWLTLHTSCARR